MSRPSCLDNSATVARDRANATAGARASPSVDRAQRRNKHLVNDGKSATTTLRGAAARACLRSRERPDLWLCGLLAPCIIDQIALGRGGVEAGLGTTVCAIIIVFLIVLCLPETRGRTLCRTRPAVCTDDGRSSSVGYVIQTKKFRGTYLALLVNDQAALTLVSRVL